MIEHYIELSSQMIKLLHLRFRPKAQSTTIYCRLNTVCMVQYIRWGAITTNLPHYHIYNRLLLASKFTNFIDFAVRMKRSGTYAFALEAGLWALDSDRLLKILLYRDSPKPLSQNKWDLCYVYPSFATPTSRPHAHQSTFLTEITK